MTLKMNSRLAGFAFLLYIVVGIADMRLFGIASRGADTAARLANIAQHETLVRASALLALVMGLCAVVLGITLYALTRDFSPDLALLAAACRIVEGANNVGAAGDKLQLLRLATDTVAASGADAAANHAVASTMLNSASVGSALIFAVGSTIFSFIFLRARTIPAWIAWLGVVSSLLLVIALPLQTLNLLPSVLVWPVWMPALVFEVSFAIWLLIRGVSAPSTRNAEAIAA